MHVFPSLQSVPLKTREGANGTNSANDAIANAQSQACNKGVVEQKKRFAPANRISLGRLQYRTGPAFCECKAHATIPPQRKTALTYCGMGGRTPVSAFLSRIQNWTEKALIAAMVLSEALSATWMAYRFLRLLRLCGLSVECFFWTAHPAFSLAHTIQATAVLTKRVDLRPFRPVYEQDLHRRDAVERSSGV